MKTTLKNPLFIDDNKEYFDSEKALAYLLLQGICTLSNQKYITYESNSDSFEIEQESIVVFVFCSDTFLWGSSDREEVTLEELPELHKLCREYPMGHLLWVCKKRNMQPQKPMKDMLVHEHSWPEWAEQLPKNPYDELFKK